MYFWLKWAMEYDEWCEKMGTPETEDEGIYYKEVDDDGITVKITQEEFDEYEPRPLQDRKIFEEEEFKDERTVEVISREEWGARPPKEVIPLQLPVKKVGINFNSFTADCFTKEECIKMCREMQDRDMDKKGLPDIAYNFMVGGDGYVYEGRGWTGVPHCVIDNADYPELGYEEMIDVVYIGDWENKFQGPDMYQTYISWLQDHTYFDKKYVVEDFQYL